MTPLEVQALNKHFQELAELLEVPVTLFDEVKKWARSRIKEKDLEEVFEKGVPVTSIPSGKFWMQVPVYRVTKTGVRSRDEYLASLQGKLSNGEVVFSSLTLTEREYEYSLANGRDGEYIKKKLKLDLLNKIVKECLEFEVK